MQCREGNNERDSAGIRALCLLCALLRLDCYGASGPIVKIRFEKKNQNVMDCVQRTSGGVNINSCKIKFHSGERERKALFCFFLFSPRLRVPLSAWASVLSPPRMRSTSSNVARLRERRERRTNFKLCISEGGACIRMNNMGGCVYARVWRQRRTSFMRIQSN